MFEKLKNLRKKLKKSRISAAILTDNRGKVINEFQVFQGRAVPLDVNIKSLSETELKAYPLINDPLAQFSGVIQHPYGIPSQVSLQTLWSYAKGSAEVIAIFSAITEDIISDGYYLEGGRNQKKQAEEWLNKNNFKEVMTSMFWDALATGNGYIWKSPTIGEKEIKSLIDKLPLTIEDKTSFIEEMKAETPNRTFACVPSSTMKINYTIKEGILGYVQTVGTQHIQFNPEEIIHFRLMKLDGKMYGFTPLASITAELDTLSYIKDYARYFFEKGGVPNKIYILKNETPDSPTTKAFKRSIQQYAGITNKWKSLVLTGEIEIKDVQISNKDMEFRELARYITQVLVMEWGIPANRLSDMLIEKGVRGATVSQEGYYRKISHYQDLLEDMINQHLMMNDVKLKFNRTYKQDEVREVQIEKIKVDRIEQLLFLGLIDREYAWKDLKIPEKTQDKIRKAIKKDPYLEPQEMKPSSRRGGSRQYGQEQLNKQQMLSEGEEKRADSLDKQDAALKTKSFSRNFGSVEVKDIKKKE